jgi:hypothetical protein
VIQRVFAGISGVTSSAATDPQTYWTLIRADLDQLAGTDLHAFAGFDDQEVQQCLQRSTIIAGAAGDRLLKKRGIVEQAVRRASWHPTSTRSQHLDQHAHHWRRLR